MPIDLTTYLNGTSSAPMFSKLEREIADSKQAKAPATQWIGQIEGLTQKGVRALEIADARIIDWLQSHTSSLITKDEILEQIKKRTPTIKEVVLGTPKYSAYKHNMGAYTETLYIANSEKDNIQDEIDRIDYELEQLSFDLDRLADDPDSALHLASQRANLMDIKGEAIDFASHHYSDVVTGILGRNLLAHTRATVGNGIFFLQEIQSDWAQQGRKNGFRDSKTPRGPFVTDTEAWSGMVLRRQMQIAARNNTVKTFVWTRGFLRNGWRRDEHEKDGLDDFYVKILPKIADKALKGSDVKTSFQKISIQGTTYDLPGFEMTDNAREILIKEKSMYSRSQLLPAPRDANDPHALEALRRGKEMLGSAKHIKMFAHVFDISTGRKVAGKFVNNLAMVALDAKDINEAVDHEAFHFAREHLLSSQEVSIIRNAFRPGSALNAQVRSHLLARNDHEAALQCSDPEEAAAHGFAFWQKGTLQVKEPQTQSIFNDLKETFKDCVKWFKRTVLQEKLQSVEDIFVALASGQLAEMQADHEETIPSHHPRSRA